jgi:glycosyltransferase involved in cell wall biosynthesis
MLNGSVKKLSQFGEPFKSINLRLRIMRITFVCPYYYPYSASANTKAGDFASSATDICERLSKRGHKVIVISRRMPGNKKHAVVNGVEVYRLRFLNKKLLRSLSFYPSANIIAFINEIKGRSDAFVCWNWPTIFSILPVAKLLRVPIVCSMRGASLSYLARNRVMKWVYRFIEKFVIILSKQVIYASLWTKKTFGEKKGIVLHQGIDIKTFNPKGRRAIKLDNVVIGFFGRFDEKKGINLLIKALENVEGHYTMVFIGDGPERGFLEKASERDKRIVVKGFVPRTEIPGYIASCDIVILPSLTEGFSSVIIEAMAMGKAVIATKVGGAPEVITNMKNGLLIKPNVSEITMSLNKLIGNKRLRTGLGFEARRTMEGLYDWNKKIIEWEGTLSSL